MKTFIVLLLSCASVLGAEALIPLKSGETNSVSYGLFCLVSDSTTMQPPPGANLVLALRNIRGKDIDIHMDNVTVENFSLQDAKGQKMVIYLRRPLQTMSPELPTLIFLVVPDAGGAPQPWTLNINSKPEANQHVDLTITGIKPRDH